MKNLRQAIMTVAVGSPAEKLDRTFLSFARDSHPPLHAFIIGSVLPERRFAQVNYHLIKPMGDFSDPVRELYFRRLLLMDELDVDYVMVVDCYDVLCMQPLPSLEELLGNKQIGACTEHAGGRYILGQGYTANYLNGGVTVWDVKQTRHIREEIYNRGKDRFRAIVDDQLALNEVVQTKYYNQLRILPCQYNYRAHLYRRQRGWPTVQHLDGVVLFHNGACIEDAKCLLPVRPHAELESLIPDRRILGRWEQLWRRLRQRFHPHVVK